MSWISKILGLCEHKWKYIRTDEGETKCRVMDVLECEKCGMREAIAVNKKISSLEEIK